MGYKTAEEYLWDLKMTFIKALATLLVGSIAFSQVFSSKEFASNSYLLFTIAIWIFFILGIIEVMTAKPRKSRAK